MIFLVLPCIRKINIPWVIHCESWIWMLGLENKDFTRGECNCCLSNSTIQMHKGNKSLWSFHYFHSSMHEISPLWCLGDICTWERATTQSQPHRLNPSIDSTHILAKRAIQFLSSAKCVLYPTLTQIWWCRWKNMGRQWFPTMMSIPFCWDKGETEGSRKAGMTQ